MAAVTVPSHLAFLVLKGCLLGSCRSRRAEALNPHGLSADGSSPLVPSAQHGLPGKPVGVAKVQLSESRVLL